MAYSEMSEELAQGCKIEKKEHSWLSEEDAMRLAQDHLKEYGSDYYEKQEPESMEKAEVEEPDDNKDSKGDKMSMMDKVKASVAKRKISKTMGEFKLGELHSGSKEGTKVTNRRQAIAIALSQAKRASKK